MKYIRTKDRIIDTSDCKEHFLCNQKCWQPLKDCLVYEKDIIKQANNIDELLDQVVYVKDKSFEVYLHLSEKKYDLEQMKKGCTIYGAIWTDKGLIYVAKLNEKGEWELI